MVEFQDGFCKFVRLSIFFVVKSSQMHFVNHQFVDRSEVEIVAFPVKPRVVDHRVSHRAGDLPRVGIDPHECLVAGHEPEPIFAADGGRGDVCVPVSIPLLRHGVRLGRPIVERAGHEHRVGVGGPDTKCDAGFVWKRPHSAANLSR